MAQYHEWSRGGKEGREEGEVRWGRESEGVVGRTVDQFKSDHRKVTSKLHPPSQETLGLNGRYVIDLSVAAAVQKHLVKAAARDRERPR